MLFILKHNRLSHKTQKKKNDNNNILSAMNITKPNNNQIITSVYKALGDCSFLSVSGAGGEMALRGGREDAL